LATALLMVGCEARALGALLQMCCQSKVTAASFTDFCKHKGIIDEESTAWGMQQKRRRALRSRKINWNTKLQKHPKLSLTLWSCQSRTPQEKHHKRLKTHKHYSRKRKEERVDTIANERKFAESSTSQREAWWRMWLHYSWLRQKGQISEHSHEVASPPVEIQTEGAAASKSKARSEGLTRPARPDHTCEAHNIY